MSNVRKAISIPCILTEEAFHREHTQTWDSKSYRVGPPEGQIPSHPTLGPLCM